MDYAIEAQERLLLQPVSGEEVARGLHLSDTIEQILAGLWRGDIRSAVAEATAAHALAPKNFAVANALAFCLIPGEAYRSLELLSTLRPQTVPERQLVAANRIAAHLTQGDAASALAILESCDRDTGAEAFLWDLGSLVAGRPSVKFVRVDEWLATAAEEFKSGNSSGGFS